MRVFFFLTLIAFINVTVGFSQCKLEEAVKKTNYVVEAEILSIGELPQMWSESFIFNYQKVRYKVKKVIKGENLAEEITVGHAIIEGSLASDRNKPQLSQTYFFTGAEIILFLDVVNSRENLGKPKRTDFVSLDDKCSISLKAEQ